MPAILYLDGNGWVIRRKDIRDQDNQAPTGLTAHCFLSEEEGGDPIGGLEVTDVPVTEGALSAILQGEDITAELEPLLDLADEEEETLTVYDRVVIAAADYSDSLPVRVLRHRPAGMR